MELELEIQAKYEERMLESERRLLDLDAIKLELKRASSPALITEGKWDALIIEQAWKKLFGSKQAGYRVIPCDSTGDVSRSSGGANTLKSCIESSLADEPIKIALFDHDYNGYENAWKKIKGYFHPHATNSYLKVHAYGTAGAIVLPVFPSREEYASILNLPIEFYFDDQYLDLEVNGCKLQFTPMQIQQSLHESGIKLGTISGDGPHYRRILPSSKRGFAETVVPSMPKEAFNNFKLLFELISIAVDDCTVKRAARHKK